MMRPLYRISSARIASFRRSPKSWCSFSQVTARMNSDSNRLVNTSLEGVILSKWGPDTRPQEGHEMAVPFLYSPLPDELPPGVHKDLLILYAAYTGNIDRYVRLRDPNHMIEYELECVVRGIYHDTMFAKWWSLQPDHPDPDPDMSRIRSAIHARFIMNNDLSRIAEETDEECLPYLIWYPHFATGSTYEELARRKPAMKAQAARACIVADYLDSYKHINPTPDYFLVHQARNRPGVEPYYLEDLLRRAEQMGIDLSEKPSIYERWKVIEERAITHWRAFMVPTQASPDYTVRCQQSEHYNGVAVDMSPLELFVSVPEEMRKIQSNGYPLDLRQMYVNACRPGEYW